MNNMDKYLLIIKKICERIEPGKKMLQKLLYLMERSGLELNLDYTIHFFGPYSSVLDNAMHILDSQDKIDIDTTKKTHTISCNTTMEEIAPLKPKDQEIIDLVLTNFCGKTALELEAITTIDYVKNSLLKSSVDDSEVIQTVKIIKGNKFSEEYLLKELEALKEYNFIQ